MRGENVGGDTEKDVGRIRVLAVSREGGRCDVTNGYHEFVSSCLHSFTTVFVPYSSTRVPCPRQLLKSGKKQCDLKSS